MKEVNSGCLSGRGHLGSGLHTLSSLLRVSPVFLGSPLRAPRPHMSEE